jgi:hypothetical protein
VKSNQETDNTSSHILVTSSNMLGLCFIIITSLNAFDLANKTMVDELTGISILLFMISCVLSFFSMRGKVSKSARFESVADYVFMLGMLFIFTTAILLVFTVIK